MNKLKIAALITTSLFLTQAEARDNLTPKLEKANKVANFEKPDFGAYKIMSDYALVPLAIADPSAVISQKGEKALVKSTSISQLFTKGSLVKNIFNGEIAPVSGNINLLMKDNASARELASEYGVAVENTYDGGRIAVVSVNSNQDLLGKLAELKQSGKVVEARIEVLGTLYTSR
ncbi:MULTISPECIES: hypothetical protein [Pseudoalteromonas]|uniref:hypothetical protein n=1 Tax=Pseudoalteromonas TaxID=53246 RepID=UPI00029A3435|nr:MULTISPECIES: hypothetical protein [Pseudoalteromonas]AUJ69541.1 hypothetical protein PNC201_06145 [Pseudoalteromonas sp. NC201]MBR8842704.1 hypothetical protein [Pseudoalteromonas sp. JC3]MCF2827654.1 hypothetical protein [Pseudoalteromonas sp. OF5H-5]MCF2832351.1 hypothetical protein [Pseudoalteromonas sp. DL2-H6]MCF2925214.1 hypothetical protein [Pseudoalteromonas sp. DL2-H1]